LFYQLEAVHLGDLLRLSVRPGTKIILSLGFSRAVESAPDTLKCHFTEADAIKEVEYIKTLTKEELIEYSEKCKVAPKPRSRSFKGYTFNKSNNKWDVRITIEGKQQYFGSFLTEQEAISKVNEITKKRMQHTTM